MKVDRIRKWFNLIYVLSHSINVWNDKFRYIKIQIQASYAFKVYFMSNKIKTEIKFLNASKYRVYGRVISTSRAGDKHTFDICTKKR